MEAINEKLDTSNSYKNNVEFGFDTYLLSKIEQYLKNQIKISLEEVEAYYNKNKRYFFSESEIRLSSILLDDRQICDTVKAQLKHGEAFEVLASKYSLQNQTALFGGDMGYFKKNDLDEIGETLFHLKVGEWDGPFINGGKYLLLKCTDRKIGEYQTLENSSEEINQNIVSLKWFTIREDYVQELRNEFVVKSFLEKLKKIKLN